MKSTIKSTMTLIAIAAMTISSAQAAVSKKVSKAVAQKSANKVSKKQKTLATPASAKADVGIQSPASHADAISTSAAAPLSDISAPSSSTTIDAASGAEPKLIDNVIVKFESAIFGPSLGTGSALRPGDEYGNTPAPTEANMPTDITKMSGHMYSENAVVAGYRLNKTTSLTASGNFAYTPVRGAHNAIMLDPSFKIAKADLISSGNFNTYGDFRIIPSVTSPTTSLGRIAQFRSVQNPGYDLGRWNFGVTLQERFYIYDNSGAGRASKGENQEVQGGTRYRIYAGPQVAYTLSEKTQLWVLYEMEGINNQSNGFFEVANKGTDLELGVNWNPIKMISLVPYLDFPTGGRISAETTTLNLNLTAKFL